MVRPNRAGRKIDLDLLTEYVSHLRNNQGYRDSTTARKVAALKSFFSFMVDEGTLKDNPAEFLVSPRVGRTLPKHLTEEETEKLLDQPAKRGTVEGQRDLAMLELLYATGLRVSELTSLNLEDVNLVEGYIRCLGKGGKERLAYMHPHAIDVIRDYLDNARPGLANGKDEEALFLNRRGRKAHPAMGVDRDQGLREGRRHRKGHHAPHAAPQLCHPHAARRG